MANGPDTAITMLGEFPISDHVGILAGTQAFGLLQFDYDEAGLSGSAETGSTILLDDYSVAPKRDGHQQS